MLRGFYSMSKDSSVEVRSWNKWSFAISGEAWALSKLKAEATSKERTVFKYISWKKKKGGKPTVAWFEDLSQAWNPNHCVGKSCKSHTKYLCSLIWAKNQKLPTSGRDAWSREQIMFQYLIVQKLRDGGLLRSYWVIFCLHQNMIFIKVWFACHAAIISKLCQVWGIHRTSLSF